jgi:hypothetical protein
MAMAASTACDTAHCISRSPSGAAFMSAFLSRESTAGSGTGIGQPARCAATVSSAHSRSHGCSASSRCACRISRSVQGRARQAGPQPADRRLTTLAQSAANGGVRNSRSEEKLILIRIGLSMPSANTAACPGGSVTRYRLWAGVMFMVAPTLSRSSAAGSRCTILTAVFFTTSGITRAGICSAMISPSP